MSKVNCTLGKRYFRSLTDEELDQWKPSPDWDNVSASTNLMRVSRERRRRAAVRRS